MTIINGHEIAGRMPLFQEWGRRAIRAGVKTQTRRVIKPQAWGYAGDLFGQSQIYPREGEWDCGDASNPIKFPIQVGDIRVMTEPLKRSDEGMYGVAMYADDGRIAWSFGGELSVPWRWKRDTLSAMYMPHEAARTLCEITGVRVERLQDISEEDVDAEGFHGDFPHVVFPDLFPTTDAMDHEEWAHLSMQECFGVLWDSINAKRGYPWSNNPWVIAYDFKAVV